MSPRRQWYLAWMIVWTVVVFLAAIPAAHFFEDGRWGFGLVWWLFSLIGASFSALSLWEFLHDCDCR